MRVYSRVCWALVFIKFAWESNPAFDGHSSYKSLRWLTECNFASVMWLHCQLRDEGAEGEINRVGVEGRENKNSGQQHPRSLVGRQTLMLKFRSHTRLQTMLLTREGEDERRRGRESGGGGGKKRTEVNWKPVWCTYTRLQLDDFWWNDTTEELSQCCIHHESFQLKVHLNLTSRILYNPFFFFLIEFESVSPAQPLSSTAGIHCSDDII